MELAKAPRSFVRLPGGMLFILALCAAQLPGCGGSSLPAVAPVSGNISYRGQPLPHGQILMIHDSGQMAVGEIQSGGNYVIDAPLGVNRVMFQCTDEPNLSKLSPKSGRMLRLPKSLIPAKYTDYESSGLTIKVVSGQNQKDWILED